MPTVMRIANLRFYFYSKEEGRPHIHVGNASGTKVPEMKIWLDTLEVARLKGFSRKAERDILKFVKDHEELFLGKWEEFFHD